MIARISILLFVTFNALPLVAGQRVILFSPAWTNSSRELQFSIRLEKAVYRQGEPLTLLLSITNKAGAAKVLQVGSPWLKYNIRVFRGKKAAFNGGLKLRSDFHPPWDCSPSDPVPAGKSLTEKIQLETAYDLSAPGKYTIRATKWYEREPGVINSKDGKRGIDYLNASTTFAVLPAAPQMKTKP